MEFMLPNGQLLGIRFVESGDAASLLESFRKAVRESPYLLTTPKEGDRFTVAQEEEFILGCLRNPNNCFLVAVVQDRIVGSANVTQSKFLKQSHVGEFGIFVLQQFWNLGIGRKLMHAMEQWIQDNSMICYIQLQVMSSNVKAIHMYHNFGFAQEGHLARAVRQDRNTYQDLILMGKWLKK